MLPSHPNGGSRRSPTPSSACFFWPRRLSCGHTGRVQMRYTEGKTCSAEAHFIAREGATEEDDGCGRRRRQQREVTQAVRRAPLLKCNVREHCYSDTAATLLLAFSSQLSVVFHLSEPPPPPPCPLLLPVGCSYLLFCEYDTARHGTDLVILDARDIEARAATAGAGELAALRGGQQPSCEETAHRPFRRFFSFADPPICWLTFVSARRRSRCAWRTSLITYLTLSTAVGAQQQWRAVLPLLLAAVRRGRRRRITSSRAAARGEEKKRPLSRKAGSYRRAQHCW